MMIDFLNKNCKMFELLCMTELSPSSGWQKLLSLFDDTEQHLTTIPLENPDALEGLRSVLIECRSRYEALGNAMPEIAAVFSGDQIPVSIGLEITGGSGEMHLSSFVDAARHAISTFESQTVPHYVQQKIQRLCEDLRRKVVEINISLRKLQEYQVRNLPIKNAHMLAPVILKRKQEEAQADLQNQVRTQQEKIAKKKKALGEAQNDLVVAEERLQQEDRSIITQEDYKVLAGTLEKMIAENRAALLHERMAALLKEMRKVLPQVQSEIPVVKKANVTGEARQKKKAFTPQVRQRAERTRNIASYSQAASVGMSSFDAGLEHVSTRRPIPDLKIEFGEQYKDAVSVDTVFCKPEFLSGNMRQNTFVIGTQRGNILPPVEWDISLPPEDRERIMQRGYALDQVNLANVHAIRTYVSPEQANSMEDWAFGEAQRLTANLEVENFSQKIEREMALMEVLYNQAKVRNPLEDHTIARLCVMVFLYKDILEDLKRLIRMKCRESDGTDFFDVEFLHYYILQYIRTTTATRINEAPQLLQNYVLFFHEKGLPIGIERDVVNTAMLSMKAHLAYGARHTNAASLFEQTVALALQIENTNSEYAELMHCLRMFVPSLTRTTKTKDSNGEMKVELNPAGGLPDYVLEAFTGQYQDPPRRKQWEEDFAGKTSIKGLFEGLFESLRSHMR